MKFESTQTGNVFLGLDVPQGFLQKWEAFQQEQFARGKQPNLRWTPWYKFHLTILFWPSLSRSTFYQILSSLQNPSIADEITSAKLHSSIQGFHFFLRSQVLFLKETSEDIFNFHKKMVNLVSKDTSIPSLASRNHFVPHWTAARKFHSYHLQKQQSYFTALNSFEHSSEITCISLYFSRNGIYESHPLQQFSAKRRESLNPLSSF
ncbi:MAG: hypothetical protein D6767_08960 [Candidatus Hydrogenedentota bacterium]|nr:MAG: hypothetical protein D6767_08960 [Candidatus Hydrogenedentota bacterium]